jgi:predicted Zn-dependent protease
MTFLRPTLLALSCLLAAPAFSNDLPSLGDASSAIVSPQQEHQLGRAWLSLVRGQVSQLDDPQLKDFVERTVYSLSETSQLQDRRLEFVLLNSPQINAFAAPGGIIGVNGGLFLYAQTEAEYSSVLAHELAHLSQRHFARGLEAQQRMQVPVMVGMLAGIIAAAAGAGEAGIAAIASTQAAAVQEQRRFSRQNEQEADRIGLVNLEKAGFDPKAMPSMFERLMRQYRYNRTPPEFLLTHPVSESRIADTRNRAEQYQGKGITDSLGYQLMRARVQLKYEETSGVAAKRFRNMLDENPQLEAARYGLAIALIKGGQHKQAREALQPLLKTTPNDISYNLAMIDLEMAANSLDEAQLRIDRLLGLYPNNYPINQAKINLLIKQGRIQDAERDLDALLKRRSKDPDIWYQMAEVRGLKGDTIGLHQARGEFFALVGDYNQALEQLGFAKRRASNNFQLASRIDARERELIEEKRIIEQMMR